MKTTTISQNYRASRSVTQFRIIAFLLIACSLLITNNTATAQKLVRSQESFGLRASSTISANRFGAIYSPSLFYKLNRSIFSAGVMVQKENFHSCGFQTNYEYTILDGKTGECYLNWLELFAFANAGYYSNVYLNQSVCEEERTTNPGFKGNLTGQKMKALETYAGFGLRIGFRKNFKWFSSIGIGGYDVLNAPKGLYYNTHAVGLLMRTGISFQLNKITRMHV